MAKVSFFTVIFTVVLTSLVAFSQTTKTTLKESFLVDYVAQKENVKPDDVRRIVLKKDKNFKHGVILLNSSLDCGLGLCSYYVFVKNSVGSFDFAGMIEGIFQKTKEVAGSNLPEIITEFKSGSEKSSPARWTYNTEKKLYETK